MRQKEREIIYKTFSKLCYYPDEELANLIKDGVITEFLISLNPDNNEIQKFEEWVNSFNSTAELLEELQVEYTSLFITNFPSVPAPMFKSYYFEKEIFGESTERIMDIYEQYDFKVSELMKEPADHLAIMLEFMYRIIQIDNTYDVQIHFINDEILSWMKPFEKNVASASSNLFYPIIIKTIINYLKNDITQFETKLAGAEL